jgi:hypothetical protein
VVGEERRDPADQQQRPKGDATHREGQLAAPLRARAGAGRCGLSRGGLLGEDRPRHEVHEQPCAVGQGQDADRQPDHDGVDPEPARHARADTRHDAFVAAADQAVREAGYRWLSGR